MKRNLNLFALVLLGIAAYLLVKSAADWKLIVGVILMLWSNNIVQNNQAAPRQAPAQKQRAYQGPEQGFVRREAGPRQPAGDRQPAGQRPQAGG